jgi:dTDP-4-amino-4,6-dideoxygalactose transaminase
MPNLNAALGCAQMECLHEFISKKKQLAKKWNTFFEKNSINFVNAIDGNIANHWLNTIILDSVEDRDEFLMITNKSNVMTRPIWTLMSKLPMYNQCQTDGLENSIWLEDRIVNIPSSVPDEALIIN